MKAIILAAGVGNRLKPITDKIPKSLIRIGDRTILERMLDSLAGAGVKNFCIVIGHLGNMIAEAVGKDYKGIKVKYIANREYELGSILSLWAAREEFLDDDLLIMDADVVFEPEILSRSINSKNHNCFLMDKGFKESGEEMKIAAVNKRVVQIARRITLPNDEVGEGVGFFKLSSKYIREFLTVIDGMVTRDRACDYEDALDEFVRKVPAGFEDITGLKWTEIDFSEDIKKAESLMLTQTRRAR